MTTNTTTTITPYEGEISAKQIAEMYVFFAGSEVSKSFNATVRKLTHCHHVNVSLDGHVYLDSTGDFFMSTMDGGDGHTTVDIYCFVNGVLSIVEVPIHTTVY